MTGLSIIRVTLPWPPKGLRPNSRASHWAAHHRAFKAHKFACIKACWAAGLIRKIDWAALHVQLVFHPPPDGQARDMDNMMAAMKAGIDAIAHVTGIDDRLWDPLSARGEPVKGGAVLALLSPHPFGDQQ